MALPPSLDLGTKPALSQEQRDEARRNASARVSQDASVEAARLQQAQQQRQAKASV